MPGISKAAREEVRRLHAEGLKRCSTCAEIKPHADYNRSASRWDGLASNCRTCSRLKGAATTDAHRARWATEDPYSNPADKRCPRCSRDLPRSAFSRSRANVDGLAQNCRECAAVLDSSHRARRSAHWQTADPYSNLTPKRCPRCERDLPRPSFPRRRSSADGLSVWCAECVAADGAETRRRNRARWTTAYPYADPRPKTCGRCAQSRPRSDFSTSPGTADGLTAWCRPCKADAQSARKARQLSRWVEDVDRAVLWARDGGVCYLCGLPADPSRWDVEHVVPVIAGGEHSYANTGVSHPACNAAKLAKEWPVLDAFDPSAPFAYPAPAYPRGVMLVFLPGGEIRRGTETISAAVAEADEAAAVVPDDDEHQADAAA